MDGIYEAISMTPFERSALIGWNRQGATMEQMELLTGLTEESIKRIIDDYEKNNPASEATEESAGSI